MTDPIVAVKRIGQRAAPGVLVCLYATIALMMQKFMGAGTFGDAGVIDYHIFHLVGTMIREGSGAAAYDVTAFAQIQSSIVNDGALMLWSYPPVFGLVVACFSLVPVWLGYGLFMSGTLALYLLVLHRLSGDWFGVVLIAALPFLMTNILTGQNGFLTGAIAGLFCLWIVRSGRRAGLPLGLMIVKPHLAVGLSVLALVSARWGVIAVAAVTVLVSAALSGIFMGWGIWPAFLDGMQASGEYLSQGGFQLFRMTSVFAALTSFGLPGAVALGLHVGVACIALGAVVAVQMKGWSARRITALAAVASALVSPYGYDYDMALIFLALALAAPDLARLASKAECAALVLSGWLASGYGLFISLAELRSPNLPSIGAFGTILVLVLILRIFGRAQATAETAEAETAPA